MIFIKAGAAAVLAAALAPAAANASSLRGATFEGLASGTNGLSLAIVSPSDTTGGSAPPVVQPAILWVAPAVGAANAKAAEPAMPPPSEQQTYALMLAGLGSIGFLSRRRRQD
jgi:hypothetical protein